MIEGMTGRERVGFLRNTRRESEIVVLGVLCVEAVHKKTGSRGKATQKNTILAKNVLVELAWLGNQNFDYLTQENASIVIRETDADDGPVRYENIGADGHTGVAATNATNGARRRWRWDEKTANEYFQLNYAELWNGDPTDLATGRVKALTRVPCAQAIKDAIDDAGGAGSLGHKPTDYNLIFNYDLELYSNDNPILTALNSRWLLAVAGAVGSAGDPDGSTGLFSQGNLRIQPKDAGGANVGAVVPCTSVNGASGESLVAKFVSAPGDNAGVWDTVVVQHNNNLNTWGDVRAGGCSSGGGTCGEKGLNDDWTWQWTYTLVEG